MKTLRSVLALAALAAFVFFGPQVLIGVLTGTPITGASPFRELVNAMRVASVLLVVSLVAVASFQRDERQTEEALMNGLRLTVKVHLLVLRIVIAIVATAMLALLVVGAAVGLFSPTDVAIYLGTPLLIGFAAGFLFRFVKAYNKAKRNNYPAT